MQTLIRLPAILAMLTALGGCFTSETGLLAPEDSIRLAGMSEGMYCHAENKLVPPQVGVSPQISESLGSNKCRDLHWNEARHAYVDRLSPTMELLVGEVYLPELLVMQARTGNPGAPARFMPLAAVDGLFILYDGAGEWPEGVAEASGLELTDDGILKATDPSYVRAVVGKTWDIVLERFRQDVAFVEDEAGPRLEFRRVDTAYSYIVYFKEDWAGDTERMRAAMLALADSLKLGKYESTWTTHAE